MWIGWCTAFAAFARSIAAVYIYGISVCAHICSKWPRHIIEWTIRATAKNNKNDDDDDDDDDNNTKNDERKMKEQKTKMKKKTGRKENKTIPQNF